MDRFKFLIKWIMISVAHILDAARRIEPYTVRTPVLTNEGLNEFAGCTIFFKCENFQAIGAFKARGAMNAILSMTAAERKNGVATHSSGNHAQAVARAAKIMKTRAWIVMPRTAASIKKKGVIYHGGSIIECEPTLTSREVTLADIVKKTGAAVIHPFNDYSVIAGQATAAKELFEQSPNLDVIMAPVGGGGLLSGTALVAKYFSPHTLVIAGEPEGADDAYRSFQSGKIETSQANTIADGLLASLGDKTFPIIREHVNEIIPVSDSQIIEAMKMLWANLKIIVEPSGAVAFAALLKAKDNFSGKRIGIILTGGNVDLERAFGLFSITDQTRIH